MTLYTALRDTIQRAIYNIIDAPIRTLVRMGVTPNMVTFAGLLGNIAAAAIMISAANSLHPYLLIGCSGVVILLSSALDMVDGRMARVHGLQSSFGAFWDSVLDRYCEIVTLSAIIYLFFATGHNIFAFITIVSLGGSLMVSYIRARAEAMGKECKVGHMQRPERVVLTSMGAILCGITGCLTTIDALWFLSVPQMIIALMANITAIHRIYHVWRQMV